jgi:hypothetical protein
MTRGGTQQCGAWAERARCYTALSAVLAEHAGEPTGSPGKRAGGRRTQSPIEVSGLLKLVAARAHFAGAEPVYRRYRHRQDGQPTARWASLDPSVKPAAALVAEAKIVAFWPYREGVIKVADAFDMSPTEWAAAYLRALAAWAGDHLPLAACRPAGPPECIGEDMTVLALAVTPTAGPADVRSVRLRELAGNVVQAVLDDASITPLGAFNTVRDEVRRLLTVPPGSLADRLAHAIAELSDQLIHTGPDRTDALGESVAVTTGQVAQLRSMVDGLATLLAEFEVAR